MISKFGSVTQTAGTNRNQTDLQHKPLERSDYKASVETLSGSKLVEQMGAPPKFSFQFGSKRFGMSKEYGSVVDNLKSFEATSKSLADIPIGKAEATLKKMSASLNSAIQNAEAYIVRHADNPEKAARSDVMRQIIADAKSELSLIDQTIDKAENFSNNFTAGGVHTCLRHGIDHESLISNVHARDKMIGEPELLGKGGVNSVYSVKYETHDGKIVERILKPLENTKLEGLGKDAGIGISYNNLQAGQRNIASSIVAGLLGNQAMIPKPEIIVHGDRVFLEMEVAPGEDLMDEYVTPVSDGMNAMMREWVAIGRTDDIVNARAKVIGTNENNQLLFGVRSDAPRDVPMISDSPNPLTASLQKGMLDLQVIDLLCGQVDRHQHNYFIRIDGDQATVTGIDNDTSFGGKAGSFYNLPEKATDRDRFLVPWPGLPPLISLDMFGKLMDITPEKLTEALGPSGLGPQELDVAVQRLQKLKAHAIELEMTGRVVENFEEWTYTDPNTEETMDASTYLQRHGQDSYINQYVASLEDADKGNRALVPLDSRKHNFDA